MKKAKFNIKNILWSILFLSLVSILIVEYIVLFGMKTERKELDAQTKVLDEQIEDLKEEEYIIENVTQDNQSLDEYAIKNGYYNSDEVYIVK